MKASSAPPLQLKGAFDTFPRQYQLLAAIDAFARYADEAIRDILEPRQRFFASLEHEDRELYRSILSDPHFDALKAAINANANIARAIASHAVRDFGLDKASQDPATSTGSAPPEDIELARFHIKQLFRDWSDEPDAKAERLPAHGRIKADLDLHCQWSARGSSPKVLVPGAGLCRLAADIAAAGFHVEAVESDFIAIIAAHYMLCHTQNIALPFHPWATGFSNHFTAEDRLQQSFAGCSVPWRTGGGVLVLNTDPLHLPIEGNEAYDAVASCYFIDAVPNVLRTIDTVWACLKPGGLWSNSGPLLWYADEPLGEGAPSAEDGEELQGQRRPLPRGKLELAGDEVRGLLVQKGFQVRSMYWGDEHDEHSYIQNTKSMLNSCYRTSHWTVIKPMS